ncbi:response regulator transcription factor [Microbacterium sp. CFH 90308]|uniref:Response regulator transcription factor n=1 Tax=Microbacterium salsuginis TaxID=2722803 RepID=A0ABX1KHX1_9MICO|nr:response regulator transcription factor [Microbacterium sp. CFH 90308]NLP85598.1 response regulator transcription factor [Microbacterium sp. CFH 90308]
MTETIRVLLVDDQELIRLGFRLVLDAEPDIEVIGEAADGDEAIRAVLADAPDVVLMDIRMPRTDGITATREIVRAHPGTRVLVLTTFDLDEYAFGALDAGAGGFLLKDAQRSELTAAIRAVHRGDAVLAPPVTRRLVERLRAAPAPTLPDDEPDPTAELTDRERDVFLAIAQGLTNAEIARHLFVSESTVKTHVGRVLAKIGARDRVHAVILAHRHRLVDASAPLPPDTRR